MGSILVARRAGTQQAASVEARSATGTHANVAGSAGWTRNNRPVNRRVAPSDASVPMAAPTEVSAAPSPITVLSTSALEAPSAMRTPISCVTAHREADDAVDAERGKA